MCLQHRGEWSKDPEGNHWEKKREEEAKNKRDRKDEDKQSLK